MKGSFQAIGLVAQVIDLDTDFLHSILGVDGVDSALLQLGSQTRYTKPWG